MRIIEGLLNAKGQKFAIIISRFNSFITDRLLTGAIDCLTRHNCNQEDISVIWVPGSFEIPVVAKKIAKSKKYDAVICLGAVIKGETPHFDYVSAEVSKGVAAVALKEEIPVIFGVLTTESIEQAIERAGAKAGNKGTDAAMSAIEMASLLKKL